MVIHIYVVLGSRQDCFSSVHTEAQIDRVRALHHAIHIILVRSVI